MPLKPGNNPNHPVKGSITTVEPIRDLQAIAKIKRNLADNLTHSVLFQLGINVALRAGDLLAIKVSDLIENRLKVREEKTQKVRTVLLNPTTLAAVQNLINIKQLKPTDYLFSGQRGQLTVMYLNVLVKRWCKAVGLKGNFGSHSLRKTWGFHQRSTFNVDVPTLMTCFGHSSQRQTLQYLGIAPQEVVAAYNNEI